MIKNLHPTESAESPLQPPIPWSVELHRKAGVFDGVVSNRFYGTNCLMPLSARSEWVLETSGY